MAGTLIGLVYYVPSMRVWMTIIPDDDAELDAIEADLDSDHAMERVSRASANGVHFVENLIPLSTLALLPPARVALVDSGGNVVNVIMGDAALYNAVQVSAAQIRGRQVLTPNLSLTAVENDNAVIGGVITNGIYTPPPQAPDPVTGIVPVQQILTP